MYHAKHIYIDRIGGAETSRLKGGDIDGAPLIFIKEVKINVEHVCANAHSSNTYQC